MNKDQLILSAKNLADISPKTAKEYIDRQIELIDKMNQLMLSRDDIDLLVGETNLQMMKDNHENHARFISSILIEFHPETLVETILWVFRAYRSRGFSSNYWASQLNTWMKVFREVLSKEAYREVEPLYEWMLLHIPTFVILSDEKLESEFSLH